MYKNHRIATSQMGLLDMMYGIIYFESLKWHFAKRAIVDIKGAPIAIQRVSPWDLINEDSRSIYWKRHVGLKPFS